MSKLTPYECGVDPVGTGQERFPVSFFMTGIIFIIFSVVAVFLYLWAVIYRKLGEFGLEAMGVFLLIVMIGFVYVWMKGAFEWD